MGGGMSEQQLQEIVRLREERDMLLQLFHRAIRHLVDTKKILKQLEEDHEALREIISD